VEERAIEGQEGGREIGIFDAPSIARPFGSSILNCVPGQFSNGFPANSKALETADVEAVLLKLQIITYLMLLMSELAVLAASTHSPYKMSEERCSSGSSLTGGTRWLASFLGEYCFEMPAKPSAALKMKAKSAPVALFLYQPIFKNFARKFLNCYQRLIHSTEEKMS
jgi:hypothetical protein